MEMLTGFNAIADREGFIVVYPDGRDRMWNSNPADPLELIAEPLDDVAFITALLDRLCETFAIDKSRVYVTGASQGGLMAQRIAGEFPERFAAAATVMTTLPKKWPSHVQPKSSLPFLIIHGKEDPFLPWSGGEVFEGPSRMIDYLSAPDSARFWAKSNSCDSESPLREELPDTDPDDGAQVFRETYAGGSAGDVVLYGVRGGGHTWPGGRINLPDILMGNTTYDIKASDVIWEFFAQHKRT